MNIYTNEGPWALSEAPGHPRRRGLLYHGHARPSHLIPQVLLNISVEMRALLIKAKNFVIIVLSYERDFILLILNAMKAKNFAIIILSYERLFILLIWNSSAIV